MMQVFTATLIFLPLILSESPVAKHGVGMAYRDCSDAILLQADWIYDWWPTPMLCSPEIESIPMIWGKGDVGKPISGSSGWLMGFNEPDLVSQANISPTLAAQLWRQVESNYPSKMLVSPANSHGNVLGWEGTPWLVQFRDAYINFYGEPPRLDALALHCYSNFPTCSAAVDAALVLAAQWDISQVWLTEFGYADCWQWGGTLAAQQFMRDMTAYCQQHDVRYAWFTNRQFENHSDYLPNGCSTVLIDWWTHEPTALGETWIDLGSGAPSMLSVAEDINRQPPAWAVMRYGRWL